MKTILKTEPTKRYNDLMKAATTIGFLFKTGMPLSIHKYGINSAGRLVFISYITEKGVEDTYRGDSLASALSDVAKMIEFQLK